MTKQIILIVVVVIVIAVAVVLVRETRPPSNEERAFAAIDRVFDEVLEYHRSTGEWPTSLSQIADTNVLFHDGMLLLYNPTNLQITVPVMYDTFSPLHYITFGLMGDRNSIGNYSCGYSSWLEEETAEQESHGETTQDSSIDESQ